MKTLCSGLLMVVLGSWIRLTTWSKMQCMDCPGRGECCCGCAPEAEIGRECDRDVAHAVRPRGWSIGLCRREKMDTSMSCRWQRGRLYCN